MKNWNTQKTGLALLFLSFASSSQAALGSNWGNPGNDTASPAWSAGYENYSQAPRKGFLSREKTNVAPFSPGSNNVSLDVGQIFLMGDLGSNYSDAIGAKLHYTYGVSDLFGFDASASYSDHSDGRMSMSTLVAGLRTNLAWYDKVVPHVVFGMGFYRPSIEIKGITNPKTTTSLSPLLFGVHLGPGVDLEVTRQLYFGAGLTFHQVFGTTKYTSENQRIEVGGTFASFLLHAGFTF